jgi:hypothetical protein
MTLIDLDGTLDGTGDATGDPGLLFSFGDTIAGSATESGSIASTYLLGGLVEGLGSLSGGVDIDLSGLLSGTGSVSLGDGVTVYMLGGLLSGFGQLLESIPLPLYGSGDIRGYLDLIHYPPPISGPCRKEPQSFRWGQTLTNGDLTFGLKDGYGNFFSPQVLSYALYMILPGGYRQLVGATSRHPIMTSTGCYYVTGVMSCGQPGNWVIVWKFQRHWWTPAETFEVPFRVLDAVLAGGNDPTPRCKKYGWD